MDRLAAMQTFVSIVDAGSLTGAAQALGKALPTVVRSLGLLEEHLGVRLLHRTTRRMSLTAEGRTYLERCRQILGDVAEAEAVLSQDRVQLAGEIRVTAPVLFGQLRVAPAITEFLEEHPRVRIELVLLDRVADLIDEGFDVGVRIARLEDSSLVSSRIGEVRRVVVASPALLDRVGEPKHPKELAGVPTVGLSGVVAAASWSFDDRGKRLVIPVRGALTTNHVQAGIDACARGLGFGRFLSYQVEARVEAGELRIVLGEFEPAPTPVHVVLPHGRLLSARTRALVDWLKTRLGS